MKRLALSLFATIMLDGLGFWRFYAYSKAGDTPACCQKPGSAAAPAWPAARVASVGWWSDDEASRLHA